MKINILVLSAIIFLTQAIAQPLCDLSPNDHLYQLILQRDTKLRSGLENNVLRFLNKNFEGDKVFDACEGNFFPGKASHAFSLIERNCDVHYVVLIPQKNTFIPITISKTRYATFADGPYIECMRNTDFKKMWDAITPAQNACGAYAKLHKPNFALDVLGVTPYGIEVEGTRYDEVRYNYDSVQRSMVPVLGLVSCPE